MYSADAEHVRLCDYMAMNAYPRAAFDCDVEPLPGAPPRAGKAASSLATRDAASRAAYGAGPAAVPPGAPMAGNCSSAAAAGATMPRSSSIILMPAQYQCRSVIPCCNCRTLQHGLQQPMHTNVVTDELPHRHDGGLRRRDAAAEMTAAGQPRQPCPAVQNSKTA